MGACRQISDCLLDNVGVPQATACPADGGAAVCDVAQPPCAVAAGEASALPFLVGTLWPPRVTFTLQIFSGIFLNPVSMVRVCLVMPCLLNHRPGNSAPVRK